MIPIFFHCTSDPIFFRERSDQGSAKIYMVDILGRQEFAVPTPPSASDPAWSPLLN